jgi:hypothetical protein
VSFWAARLVLNSNAIAAETSNFFTLGSLRILDENFLEIGDCQGIAPEGAIFWFKEIMGFSGGSKTRKCP